MLIDTPEDIAVACNRQRISEVKHLSISHSDPDHVRGIRIVEKIGCDFIKGTSMPVVIRNLLLIMIYILMQIF